MRINNKRVTVLVNTVYTLLLIGLLGSLLLLFIPIGTLTSILHPYTLILIFIVLIWLFKKMGPHQMEYSSDGEVFNIKTQDPYWVKYFPRSQKIVDFPKRKLIDYSITGPLFHRKLNMYISSKRAANGVAKVSFNITFLSRREINDMKRSLKRNVKRNREEMDKTRTEKKNEA